MTIRAPGTVNIDGVNYQLTKQKDTNAWFWHYNSSIAPPQQVTPEETVLSSTQSGYKRTAGWLDWSHGGVGPSIYASNVRWLSSSQGPITEYARKIIQPIKLQTTDSAGATLVLAGPLGSGIPYYGRVVDFAVGPVEANGTQLIFALQELGCARRITFSQATASSAITIGLATHPTIEADEPDRTTGAGHFAAGTSGVSDGFAVPVGLLNLTEGGPLWSYPVSSVLTPHLLVGADHTGIPTANASFFLYKAGANVSTAGIWEQAGSVGSPNTGILRGRFQVGMYASGPLLWASASTTRVESTSSYGAGILNLSAQQDPFTLSNWTSDLFGIFGLAFSGRRVGTDHSSIVNAITILRDAVLVATNDGMFYKLMTSGELSGVPVPLIDSKAAIPEVDSGRTMTIWNGIVYIPTARGLFMFQEFNGKDGGTLVGVGPEFIPGNQSPIRGKCVLYAGDPEYLHASFYNGTDSYVMKGRMPKDGEDAPGAMIWHAACPYIKGEEVTAITIAQPKHTGKTNPVLILGCKASVTSLKYVVLPKTGLTLLSDALCLPSTSGSYEAILPEHDAMAPSLWKTFLRLNVVANKVSVYGTSYNAIEVYYKVDSNDWASLGLVTFSPLFNIPFPNNTIGYKISIKFIWRSNTSVFSYIEAVSFDFVQRVNPAKTVDVQVLANPSRVTFSGPTKASAGGRLEYLEQLKDDGITFSVIGPDGNEHFAQIDQSTGISWRPTEQGHSEAFPNVGYMAQFKLNLYDDFVRRDPAIYGEVTESGAVTIEGSDYAERGLTTFYDDNVVVSGS